MKKIVSKLQAQGLITNVIGDIPNNKMSPALVMWARREPKEAFLQFIALSKVISKKPLTVFIDDICTQLVLNRNEGEQREINELYRDFFVSNNCNMRFSSDLYKTLFPNGLIPSIIELSKRLSFNEFLHCLPIEKRGRINELALTEVFHALLELLLLDQVRKECNLLLIGHFSQAIAICHRKIHKNSLSVIAVPKLNNASEIILYQQTLTNFLKK